MIDTVINYCTIDFKFLKKNIQECIKFSNNVIIPVCDHFFDGEKENQELLNKTYALQEISSKVKFIPYDWNSTESAKYHHNLSRWLGIQNSKMDYVLTIDADEVIEGDLMKEYLVSNTHQSYDAVSFQCYWYFREPIYRAKSTELAPVLFNRGKCTESIIFHNEERWTYRHQANFIYKENETYNNQILCNHYSWVRTKEEMLRKVKSWGHSTDGQNWIDLVNEEFSREFNGTDFVHNYEYEVVENRLL